MAKADKQSSYNFIDLFAGAGGLSEGFIQAGFHPVAHVEMNEYAAKTLETRSAYYYLKNSGNLALYGKYLSGDISRDELMKMIPASVTKTVINETLSDETLPAVFKTIDGIMEIRGIRKIDVIVGGPPGAERAYIRCAPEQTEDDHRRLAQGQRPSISGFHRKGSECRGERPVHRSP